MPSNHILPRPIVIHPDARGTFRELFRASWFPEFVPLQINMSTSKAGVLRGLHYHKLQTDVWFPIKGTFQVAFIYDLFTTDPKHITMELQADSPQAILIPPTVAHGYLALTDDAIMGYCVDSYYNPADEHTLCWDAYSIPWRTETPILSDRDKEPTP